MPSFENSGAPGVVVRVAYLTEDCEGGVIFVPWGIGILDCLARRASSLDRMTDQPTDRRAIGSGFRDRRGRGGLCHRPGGAEKRSCDRRTRHIRMLKVTGAYALM
jgi:hypothetical protein